MAPNRDPSQTKYTVQNMGNSSFDEDYGVNAVENLGHDGVSLQKNVADSLAVKITVVGSVTYVGIASPGTAQGTATWQCKKIDETSGTIITWADGDPNFNNVATDLTALSYS